MAAKIPPKTDMEETMLDFAPEIDAEQPLVLPDQGDQGTGRTGRSHAAQASTSEGIAMNIAVNAVETGRRATRPTRCRSTRSTRRRAILSRPTPCGRTSSACAPRTRCTSRAESEFGPYWSITKYNDIMAVDTNHEVFSSESAGGITIAGGRPTTVPLPMFIAMDPPKHDVQRKAVSPASRRPTSQVMEPLIRERAGEILDDLPIGEEFDWVDKVSIELTTMTLATLFDFPFEDRRKLTHWSDVVTDRARPRPRSTPSEQKTRRAASSASRYFSDLWNERVNADARQAT